MVDRAIPRVKYGAGMWGIKITTKERLTTKHSKPIPFGVVVTLKEMKGVNRYDEFIKLCQMHGWLVNHIDVDHRIEVYNMAEETIQLE